MAPSSSGTPLVLLGGMACDERLWQPVLEVGVVGWETPPRVADLTTADSIEGLARAVLASLPERFALVGLSLGGIVALECWHQAPERIAALGLFDTEAGPEDPRSRAWRERAIATALAGGLEALVRDQLLPRFLAAGNAGNPALVRTVLAMARDTPPDAFARQSRALMNRPDHTSTLATITCPTLVVCGAEDRLCPLEVHRAMAVRIPGAELAVLPGCGHLPPLEQPRETAQLITRLAQMV